MWRVCGRTSETEPDSDTQTDRQTHKQTDRQTDSQRQTDSDRQTATDKGMNSRKLFDEVRGEGRGGEQSSESGCEQS